MQTFNIHVAKTQLSRLVEMASKGEPFIIAKAGKPMVKVMPLNEVPEQAPGVKGKRRLGFMRGEIVVPDNFDRLYQEESEAMCYGEP